MLDFLSALCLVFVIEGALYALFPDGMKRMIEQALELPTSWLRSAGLASSCLGIVALWLIRG